MTDRLRIPVPFGPDVSGQAAVEESQLVDNRVRRLERGWHVWDDATWTATTTNPVLGNGSLEAWYRFDDRWMEVSVELTMGSTTTYGSGTWRFSGRPVSDLPYDGLPGVGWCGFRDVSAGAYYLGQVIYLSDQLAPRIPNYAGSNGATVGTTSTAPFTWASTDVFNLYAKFRYRD